MKEYYPWLFLVVVLTFSLFVTESSSSRPVTLPPVEVTDVAIVDEDIDLQELIRRQALANENRVVDPDSLDLARSRFLNRMSGRNNFTGRRLSFSG